MEDFTISALDGHQLAASRALGRERDGPVILLSSGTAIPRQFYRRFAVWLARRGARCVVTYDYRGIGGSWPKGPKGPEGSKGTKGDEGARGTFKYLMSDWARLDYPAAIDWVKREYPDAPLYTIGHSFGGQVFGLTPKTELVEKSVLIASMAGSWRAMGFPENLKIYNMLYLMGPVVGRLYGYIPGKFGLGEDMAREAFEEWARWCKKSGYFFDDPALVETRYFSNYSGPMLALGIEDDPWGRPELIENLVKNFTAAQLENRQCTIKEAGGKIGHFGFFRSRFENTLWPIVANWLLGEVDVASMGAEQTS